MLSERHSRTTATETHVGMDVPDAIAYPLALKRLFKRRRITASGCWEYTGTVMNSGYGEICFRGRNQRVHRLMYTIAKGPIPPGMDVLHSCDNTICFNPDHLDAGTDAQNIQQAVKRGRHAKVRNTHCPQGHLYATEGTIGRTTGWRSCKTCVRIRYRLQAGWPEDLARSEPSRGGSSPVANPTWRKERKTRVVKTHCVRGHELAGENLYLTPDGRRQCRACHHAAVRRFKPKRPADHTVDATE